VKAETASAVFVDVRFGSLAAVRHPISLMSGFGRIADVNNLIPDRLANLRDSAIGREAFELQGIMARYDPIA
jgi:hypothetical protein